jgi:type IV pili sensor histidine kinase/response regulator
VAIPSSEVLEIVELSPLNVQDRSLHWRSHSLTILALGDLLPPPQYGWQVHNARIKGFQTAASSGTPSMLKTQGWVGIILRTQPQPIVLQVDLLLEEREMVLKSLDPWLSFPSYIAGCTVLPQGQVVPVLSPEAVTPQSAPTVPQVPIPQETLPLPSARRVLVVDDSAAARRWVTHALQPLGYEVMQCRDGQEAWEQLQGGLGCDLLVCDVEMPRMDGFQLLYQLRQDDRWATLPVAMLTSRQSDRHRQQAQSLGASGYFVKPLGVQDLVRALEQFTL